MIKKERIYMDFEYLKNNALKQAQDWNFGTRINKKDFWSYILVLVVINILSGILFASNLPQLNSLISLAVSVLMVPVAIRRCHDINKSGWAYGAPILILWGIVILMLIVGGASFVAFVSTGGSGASLASLGAVAVIAMLFILVALGVGVYLLILFLKDSYPSENKWGPVPVAVKTSAPTTEADAKAESAVEAEVVDKK